MEFTLEEALRFIAKKEKHLQEIADRLTADAQKIKANIRIVLEVRHAQDFPFHLLVFF